MKNLPANMTGMPIFSCEYSRDNLRIWQESLSGNRILKNFFLWFVVFGDLDLYNNIEGQRVRNKFMICETPCPFLSHFIR